jgi:hypothetical protein
VGEIVEGHIGARPGIVEPPIGIFLDDNLPVAFGHEFLLPAMFLAFCKRPPKSMWRFVQSMQNASKDNHFVQCGVSAPFFCCALNAVRQE